MRRRALALLALVAVWFLAVLALDPPAPAPVAPPPAACAGAGPVEASLLLVGDAGAPRVEEPVLTALARDVAARAEALGAERAGVAFLGDNLYPAGLPAPGAPGRGEGERRLEAQLAAVAAPGVRAWFVPGNHDWDDGGRDGWEAVRRQAAFVAERSGGRALVVPTGGCPGPAEALLGAHLALVFLDTQWWLHGGPRPEAAACGVADGDGVWDALRAHLRRDDGRRVIVAGHHPLVTGGPHAARFGWRDHLFPLRALHRALWIPLPVIGSGYPLARSLGASPQDATSLAYRRFAAGLADALEAAPPLVYAAGHDHALQVIRGRSARFHVGSGAGSSAITTWVLPVEGGLYQAARPGYVRLDAHATGAVSLAVVAAAPDARTEEPFTACLTP